MKTMKFLGVPLGEGNPLAEYADIVELKNRIDAIEGTYNQIVADQCKTAKGLMRKQVNELTDTAMLGLRHNIKMLEEDSEGTYEWIERLENRIKELEGE